MSNGLHIPNFGDLDFLSLGALVHRLDPGIIPFRKAAECRIHVSGGEFNVAANLADCFGMKTAIVSAMSGYPIGDLIAERVRAMGVRGIYRHFKHNGVNGPNMATVYSDRGFGSAPAGGVLQPRQRSRRRAQARRLRLEGDLLRRRALGPLRRHLCRALAHHGRACRGDDEGRQGGRRGHVLRPQFPREAVEGCRRRGPCGRDHRPHRGERGCAGGQRGGSAEGPRHSRP